MVINWLCLTAVESNFQPNSPYACTYAQCNDQIISPQNIGLNLQHLKPTAWNKTDSHTIPANSIYNNNDYPIPKNGNTLYLMSILTVNEYIDPGSCQSAGNYTDGEPTCSIEGRYPLKLCRDQLNGLVFPYWSWKPCFKCQLQRPPRTHHCVIYCTRVLKRDHHCFFTGSSVGLHNQIHFIVSTFWSFTLVLISCCVTT